MHGAGPLMWNDALADSSFQFFKYQSMVSHHHSESYDLTAAQGGPAGENLAFGTPSISADKAVHMWYAEIRDCGPFPGCDAGAKGVVGHFTALVWKGTTVMGCAKSIDGQLIVCRYGNGPHSELSCNTPNMDGCYQENVPAATKTEGECGVRSSSTAEAPSPPAAVSSS